MNQSIYTIQSNDRIAEATFKTSFAGNTSAFLRPGQFVNLKLDGFYLRRPISVADWDKDGFTIIYKVVGSGTDAMSRMRLGKEVDILTGLGNGYDMDAAAGRSILLVGGGCGVPPLYGLAKRLVARGEHVQAAFGFDSAPSVFGAEAFQKLGIDPLIATDDGTIGAKGFITDHIQMVDYDYYFACGPEPMLRALHAQGKNGQLSFEERMGCGFGICMGCSCETLVGSKRICVDGPVMRSEEVAYD